MTIMFADQASFGTFISRCTYSKYYISSNNYIIYVTYSKIFFIFALHSSTCNIFFNEYMCFTIILSLANFAQFSFSVQLASFVLINPPVYSMPVRSIQWVIYYLEAFLSQWSILIGIIERTFCAKSMSREWKTNHPTMMLAVNGNETMWFEITKW